MSEAIEDTPASAPADPESTRERILDVAEALFAERGLAGTAVRDIAREAGLPYVYLGYWVPGSPKMGYKAKFDALEVYHDGAWHDLLDPADYSTHTDPMSSEPISDQVAKINLPDIALPVRQFD